MYLRELGISNLRNIEAQTLELRPGINAFIGPNGGGKTSLLEGAYLLSHAQSFRSGSTETIMARGASQMQVRARVVRSLAEKELRLTRTREAWSAQVNGLPVSNLSGLLEEFAVVCLEPGSHALISGSSRERRQFLDWGVFHVEPTYWAEMRTFNRVLRQRNAALKQQSPGEMLDLWDAALCDAAQPIGIKRQAYFAQFRHELHPLLLRFLPELGEPTAVLDTGLGDVGLCDALRSRRALDLLRGHTSKGPHRTDWRIGFAGAPQREHLSRGQEKLCALACVLAQGSVYAKTHGEWPVIALDDLASELDSEHQEAVIGLALEMDAQVLVTGTEPPVALQPLMDRISMFHVEHGRIAPLL